ncbi:MAG TPA: hypothetical protein V6C76_12530 [Drouetiella sp.]
MTDTTNNKPIRRKQHKEVEVAQAMPELMEKLQRGSSVPKVSKWDTTASDVATCRIYYSSAVAIVALRPTQDPNRTAATIVFDHTYATPKVLAIVAGLVFTSIICGAYITHPKTVGGWLIVYAPIAFPIISFISYLHGKWVLSRFISSRLSE